MKSPLGASCLFFKLKNWSTVSLKMRYNFVSGRNCRQFRTFTALQPKRAGSGRVYLASPYSSSTKNQERIFNPESSSLWNRPTTQKRYIKLYLRNKMNVDQHLSWFLIAVKGSIEGDATNKDKLLKNVSDCFQRVKKALASQESGDHLLEEFRIKATLLLLLCCPRVHHLPHLDTSDYFKALVSKLPNIKEADFFTVVRSQKNYRFLAPLLSWLPSEVVKDLMCEYYHSVDDVTPITLAVSLELLKSLCFSCQYYCKDKFCSNSDYADSLKPLTDFFSKKKISNETPAAVKSSGYYYLYLCECLYLMLRAYTGCTVKEPEDVHSCIETWTELWRQGSYTDNANCSLSFTETSIKTLLKLCLENDEGVSVDVWMAWSEIILPSTVQVHRLSVHSHVRAQPRSVQSVIRNIAYDVLQMLDDSLDITKSGCELQESSSKICGALSISQYSELMEFFHQVALDPDYDPDQDLNVDQLVEEIKLQVQSDAKGDRVGSLVGLLVGQESVWTSEGAVSCLRECTAHVPTNIKITLLKRFIQVRKTGAPCCPDWHEVTLELAAHLTCPEVLSVVEEQLSVGQDEILRLPNFTQQLTTIFNQIAGEDQEELTRGEKVAWLCLQSGGSVVERGVSLAVTLSGLVSVMVQALTVITPICQATLPHGVSVLADNLVRQQRQEMSEREVCDYVALVKGLLRGKALAATEVVKVLVHPSLVMKEGRTNKELLLPLELLQAALRQDISGVLQDPASVCSLVMTLGEIADSNIYLRGPTSALTLDLHHQATYSITTIINTLTNNQDSYHTEISLLKHALADWSTVHPRTLHSFSTLLRMGCGDDEGEVKVAESEGEAGLVDRVLWALMDIAGLAGAYKIPGWLETHEDLQKELSTVTRPQWISVLVQLLPHCMEREWTAAVFLTHHVLNSQCSVFPALELFAEVLYILCSVLLLPLSSQHQPEQEQQGGKKREEVKNDEQKMADSKVKEGHKGEHRMVENFAELNINSKENDEEDRRSMEQESDQVGPRQEEVDENEEDQKDKVGKEERLIKEEQENFRKLDVDEEQKREEVKKAGGADSENILKDEKREETEKPGNTNIEAKAEREQEKGRDEVLPGLLSAPISIQHCFQCFAPAAMAYLEWIMKRLSGSQRFVYLCSVFRWWCRVVPSYQCQPELPTLLLARLAAMLQNMIDSGQIKVQDSTQTMTRGKENINKDHVGVIETSTMRGKEETTKPTSGESIVGVINASKEGKVIESESDCHIKQSILVEKKGKENYQLANTPSHKEVLNPNKNILDDTNNQIQVNEKHVKGKGSTAGSNSTTPKASDLVSQQDNGGQVVPQCVGLRDYKREVEQLMWCVVKFVPPSNLLASIANKFKKLSEL